MAGPKLQLSTKRILHRVLVKKNKNETQERSHHFKINKAINQNIWWHCPARQNAQIPRFFNGKYNSFLIFELKSDQWHLIFKLFSYSSWFPLTNQNQLFDSLSHVNQFFVTFAYLYIESRNNSC